MKDVNKYTEFAKRFLSEMGRKGCTATEIAALLGITKQSVSNYTSGKAIPPIDKLHKLADYFDVTLDWLLCRPGAKRAANADIDFFCNYTGLSEENIKHLHAHIDTGSLNTPTSKYISHFMTPNEEWVPALQKFIDFAVESPMNSPVDHIASFMYYANLCFEFAQDGNEEKLSHYSKEELNERFNDVQKCLDRMEVEEYAVVKLVGKISDNGSPFWKQVSHLTSKGININLSPRGCLSILREQYRKLNWEEYQSETTEGTNNGEHNKEKK